MRFLNFLIIGFVFISILFECGDITAQTQIDSLMHLAKNESDCKKKAAILYDIAEFYYYTNLDSSLKYAQQYLESSENAKDTAWTADAQNYIAYVYDEKGEIELALEYFQKALDNFLILEDSFFIASCYINIGYMTSYGMDQAKGLNYFLEAMQIAEIIQDTGLLSDAGSNIAYYYERVDDNQTALRYYQKNLEYSLTTQDSMSIALSYANLASINIKLKNFEVATQLLLKSKQSISSTYNNYHLAYLYSSYVDCYIACEQIDSAQLYINRSENIINQLETKILEAYLYQQKGYLAFLKKDNKNCFNYLEKSIYLFKKINSIEPLSKIYAKQAEAYAVLHMFPMAYKSLQIANSLTDSLGYGILANTLGEFEQKRIHRIENEKNNLEIELTNQKVENNRIKMQRNLYTALFSILFLGTIFYFLLKIRKKNASLNNTNLLIKDQKDLVEINFKKLEINEKKLKDLNATKDRFFSIIGHDLKNPFNALCGLTEVLISKKELRDFNKIIYILENMNKTAKYGYALLENLLEWSRSQTGAMEPKPKKIQLCKTIEKVVQNFSATANKKNIKFKIEVDLLQYYEI
jgi:tetratricopeptide (TPR) repeat protein